MGAASQETTLVYDFGVCSSQTPLTGSLVQYTLHGTQNTTFRFTVVVDDSQFDAQVTFTPFHRPLCSFTYHAYEVRCSGPPESISRQSRNSIIIIAQLLYDRHFLRNAGYRFRFSEQDLHVPDAGKRKRKQPEQPKVTGDLAAGLVWVPQDDPSTIRNNEPLSKRPKRASAKVTIEEIQGAYKSARKQGTLKSLFVPQLQQTTSSTAHWDPYMIPANKLDDALLDEGKLKGLRLELKRVSGRVPSAAEWMTQTQAKSLTPADIHTILQIAFGAVQSQPRRLLDNGTSPVLAIGSIFLNYADHLDTQARTLSRSVLVARLIGFSVMRVYEALGPEDNMKVNEQMQRCYPGAESWQKRSRNLACYWNWMTARLDGWKGREVALYLLLTESSGEKILRELFKRSLPAAVGELATMLNSEKYSVGHSDSMKMPGIIEIVRCLLRGHVDNNSLCRAFGCPDTYLEGSATDWLERLGASQDFIPALEVVKDSLPSGNLTERLGDQEKGRSTETALPVVDEYIYSGEGILQDLDQFPYDFHLNTAHNLDSLENNFLMQF